MNLEPKFMSILDLYSPKLLSLFQMKKGAVGERLQAQLSILHQVILFIFLFISSHTHDAYFTSFISQLCW